MEGQDRRPYRAVLLVSFGLYIAACALPATDWWKIPDSYRNDDPLKGEHYVSADGWECLTLGWMFVPYGFKIDRFGLLSWIANPLALVCVVLLIFRQYRGAVAFGAASFVVAMLYVIHPPGRHDHPDVPRVGAILWLGSFFALTIATMIRRRLAGMISSQTTPVTIC